LTTATTSPTADAASHDQQAADAAAPDVDFTSDVALPPTCVPAGPCKRLTLAEPVTRLDIDPTSGGEGPLVVGAPDGWYVAWARDTAPGTNHTAVIEHFGPDGLPAGQAVELPNLGSVGFIDWQSDGLSMWLFRAPSYDPSGNHYGFLKLSAGLDRQVLSTGINGPSELINAAIASTHAGVNRLSLAVDRTRWAVRTASVAADGSIEQALAWMPDPAPKTSPNRITLAARDSEILAVYRNDAGIKLTRLHADGSTVLGTSQLETLDPADNALFFAAWASDKLWVATDILRGTAPSSLTIRAYGADGVPASDAIDVNWPSDYPHGFAQGPASLAIVGDIGPIGSARPRIVPIDPVSGALGEPTSPLPVEANDQPYATITSIAWGPCGVAASVRAWGGTSGTAGQGLYFSRMLCE
jgi:hypothetical protein